MADGGGSVTSKRLPKGPEAPSFFPGARLPFGDDLQAIRNLGYSWGSPITAHSGGGFGHATGIIYTITTIGTCAADGDSVKLPQAIPGLNLLVKNDTGHAVQIFAYLASDTIDGTAGNTGISLGAGLKLFFQCADDGDWYSSGTISTSLEFTDEVTGSGTNTIGLTITDGVVSLAKMSDLTTKTFIGRWSNSTGVPEKLTALQAGQTIGYFQDQTAAGLSHRPAGMDAVILSGYSAAGDGGGGQFVEAASGIIYNSFQDADGVWWAPSTGSADQAFWSSVISNPTLDQPVYVVNTHNRYFIGALSGNTPDRSGTPTFGWLSEAVGPNWIPRDAQMAVMPDLNCIAIAGIGRNDDTSVPAASKIGMGGAFYATNQSTAAGAVWATYIEAQVAATGVNPYTVSAGGIELNARNAGASYSETPYDLAAGSAGAYGISIAGGGDATYGPTTLHPSNFAIGVFRNGNYAFGGFYRGLLFSSEAIDGTDGSDGETGHGVAVGMARNQEIDWYASNNVQKVRMYSEVTTAGVSWQHQWTDTSVVFRGTGGVAAFQIVNDGTIANSFALHAVAAGLTPSLNASGSDTDIDIRFIPKGAGVMRFGTLTANADAPVTGYITIKDAGGTSRKLAVIA